MEGIDIGLAGMGEGMGEGASNRIGLGIGEGSLIGAESGDGVGRGLLTDLSSGTCTRLGGVRFSPAVAVGKGDGGSRSGT